GRVEQLTKLSTDVSDLTQRVHAERMAAAAYLASATPDATRYNAAIRETDAAIQSYHTGQRALVKPPAAVRGQLRRIDDQTAALAAVRRSTINRAGVAVSESVER